MSRSAAWAAISSLTAPGRGAPFWPTLEARPNRVRTFRSNAHAICRLAGSATGAPDPHHQHHDHRSHLRKVPVSMCSHAASAAAPLLAL